MQPIGAARGQRRALLGGRGSPSPQARRRPAAAVEVEEKRIAERRGPDARRDGLQIEPGIVEQVGRAGQVRVRQNRADRRRRCRGASSCCSPASTTSQASPFGGGATSRAAGLTAAVGDLRAERGRCSGREDERSKVCASTPLTNTRASVTGIQGAAATRRSSAWRSGSTVIGAMSAAERSPRCVVDGDVENRTVGPLDVAGAHVGIESVGVEHPPGRGHPRRGCAGNRPAQSTASASRCWRCRRA